MASDSGKEIEKELEEKEKIVNSLFSQLTPQHSFYILSFIVIGVIALTGYFLSINQGNPDIQKQILSIVSVAVVGGAGGYYGAKKAPK